MPLASGIIKLVSYVVTSRARELICIETQDLKKIHSYNRSKSWMSLRME
jgi:hypothetical protein